MNCVMVLRWNDRILGSSQVAVEDLEEQQNRKNQNYQFYDEPDKSFYDTQCILQYAKNG